MDKDQLAQLQQLLSDKLNDLKALGAVNRDARATVSLDQQSVGRVSRIDAMQQQAMAKAQEHQRELELANIEQALRRIDQDDYGYCLECDEEIAFKRLQISPAATHCIKCAGKS